ncbi:MAG: RidA family protein [Gammaproteobacteria bacterium]
MKKEAIFPDTLPRPRVQYSPLVKAGPLVFISGQVASDFEKGIPPAAKTNDRFPHHGSNIERQTDFIAKNLKTTLEAGGSSLENCLQMILYQTDVGEVHDASKVMEQAFGQAGVAPHTTVCIEELPVPGCTLEVDAIGFVPEKGEKIEVLNPSSLPRPVPTGLDGRPLFNYGTKAGPYIFTAGITATDFDQSVAPEAWLDPNFIYYGESARLQAEYIIDKLKIILKEGGASMADVVKANVYLTNPHDFYRFEQVWKKHFPTDPPARCTIPVTSLGVPGIDIAVDLVAYVPEDGPAKRTIHTDKAPTPLMHEPQAVLAGPFLFFSQQMATDYKTGLPAEARVDPNFPFFTSAAEKQVLYIVKNIDAICKAAGTTRHHLVRRRGLYNDFTEFFTSFVTWAEEFPSDPPASTTVRVPKPMLVPECKVAIDLMAIIPD